MELRYGINPQQTLTDVSPVQAGSWPIRLLNGEPSYINLLDALNGWQLVHEASQALGKPAAAQSGTSPAPTFGRAMPIRSPRTVTSPLSPIRSTTSWQSC